MIVDHNPFLRIFTTGLLLSLLLLACKTDPVPTPAPTGTAPPTVTVTEPVESTVSPTPTPIKQFLPTSTALPSPSASSEPKSTATLIPPPTPTASPPPLSIDAFNVDVEDVGSGKRLTFSWETTGANQVRILNGSTPRQLPWWDVASDGTLSVELPATYYRDPPMTLVALFDSGRVVDDQVVTRTVKVEWPCPIPYFFLPEPDACPVGEATSTWAAEQLFEHGRMLWLQEIPFESVTAEHLLFVLYDDGDWAWYPDAWTPDQTESDPAITPPEGFVQPIRGFGKVWRENVEVRERLGWGVASEQGYDAEWQVPIREAFPGAAYVRTFGDGVIQLAGWRTGTWQFVPP